MSNEIKFKQINMRHSISVLPILKYYASFHPYIHLTGLEMEGGNATACFSRAHFRHTN